MWLVVLAYVLVDVPARALASEDDARADADAGAAAPSSIEPRRAASGSNSSAAPTTSGALGFDSLRLLAHLQTEVAALRKNVTKLQKHQEHEPLAAQTRTDPYLHCAIEDIPQNPWNDTDRIGKFFDVTQAYSNCYVLQQIGNWPKVIWILGVVLILQWHYRHFFMLSWQKDFRWKVTGFVRKIGLNLLILSEYIGSTSGMECQWFRLPCDWKGARVVHKPFFHSLVWIFIDQVLLYGIFKIIRVWFPTLKQERVKTIYLKNLAEDAEDDGYVYDKDTATSKFEDLTIPLRQVIPVFVVQFFLLMFYVQEMNDKSKEDGKLGKLSQDPIGFNFMFWFTAIVFQMYAAESQLGEDFSFKYWTKVLGAVYMDLDLNTEEADAPRMTCWPFCLCFKKKLEEVLTYEVKAMYNLGNNKSLMTSLHSIRDESRDSFYCCRRLTCKVKSEYLIRAVLDFIANKFMRTTILYTFPMMLCVERPLDFVKDCTAILFISCLDDLPNPKHLAGILARTKLNFYYMRQIRKAEKRNSVVGNFSKSLMFSNEWTGVPQNLVPSGEERKYIENNPGEFSTWNDLQEFILNKFVGYPVKDYL